MDKFNAEEARQIAEGTIQSDVDEVIEEIRSEAERGKMVLHVNRPLRSTTIKELINRGFTVKDHSSIAMQKENLYHSIYWE